jgi:serine/threonine protein kinase
MGQGGGRDTTTLRLCTTLTTVRLTPGTRVGPYEVVALLGAGGMAEVYRAKDTRLGRDVAIKVVSEALGADEAFLERFEREARLAGSLNHPNVVALHDVGLHDGKPYFVTELLQGETLRERLSKGSIPLATALEWAAQMAQGLAAAHERGIVHRDLKPENVFITRDGHVKLLDFGIAKLVEGVQAATPHGLMDATVSPSGSSTGTGMVLGTPGYMSPEQVRGDPVDARTDFFSLSAVLYEMLCGRRAFPTGPVVESGYAILHNEPEPLPAAVPPQVAQVVQRCLEKDPARRFQSARDLAFNLELVRAPTGSVPTAAERFSKRQWRRWWLVLPPLVIGLMAVTLWANNALRRAAPPLPSIQRLTLHRGDVYAARFAPDGRTVLFTASWSGEQRRLYSTTVGSPEYHPLGVDDAILAAVSPAGELAVILHPQEAVTRAAGTLARVPGVGGAPREVAVDVWYADWAPDGAAMALIRQRGEASVAPWQLEFPVGHVLLESAKLLGICRVSPKGDLVAVATTEEDGPEGVIVVDTRGRKRTLLANWNVNGLAWAPEGDELWLGGGPLADGANSHNSLWAVSLTGQARLVYRSTGNLWLDDISQAGRVLVREVSHWTDIGVLKLTDKSVNEHLGRFDEANLGALSADGKSLLFADDDGSRLPGHHGLYLRRSDGSLPVRIGEGIGVALSSDGKWAVAVREDQPGRVWLVPTGAGASRTFDFPGLSFTPRTGYFFRDGKRAVLVAQHGDDAYQAFVLDLDGSGRSRAVTPGLESWVAVSPDERFIAALPTGGVVSAYPVEEGSPRPFPTLGSKYAPVGWGESGLILRGTSFFPPLPIIQFDTQTGTQRLLTTLSPRESTGVTWFRQIRVTPDGETVAYTYNGFQSTLYALDFGPGRH